MKRRGFLAAMLKAGMAFTILPAAELTKRLWVPKREAVEAYIQFTLKPLSSNPLCADVVGFTKYVYDGGLWHAEMEMEIKWKMDVAEPLTKWEAIQI